MYNYIIINKDYAPDGIQAMQLGQFLEAAVRQHHRMGAIAGVKIALACGHRQRGSPRQIMDSYNTAKDEYQAAKKKGKRKQISIHMWEKQTLECNG